MSERDAFERILASLYEAMLDDTRWIATSGLIDEACRTEGSVLGVGDDSARIEGTLFANFCYRGQRRQDWEREYFRDYYPVDERFPRLRQLAEGRIVHATDLFSEQELKTSPVYERLVVGPGRPDPARTGADAEEDASVTRWPGSVRSAPRSARCSATGVQASSSWTGTGGSRRRTTVPVTCCAGAIGCRIGTEPSAPPWSRRTPRCTSFSVTRSRATATGP